MTKRAVAYEDATMEWVDGNLGSKVTMKYPAVYMMDPGAHGEILSIAFAGKGQHQDAGGKVVHAAPYTSQQDRLQVDQQGWRARQLSRSAQGRQGRHQSARATWSAMRCCWTRRAAATPIPISKSKNDNVTIGHEACVSKIGEEQLFYVRSRGISEDDASSMVVGGFIEPLVKELPMEYAVEMNRLIAIQMEGTVG